jgi:membrane associated rhomboid family serine protease
VLPIRDHLPTRTVPVVNYALIAANVMAYGGELWLASNGISPEAFALVPADLVADPAGSAFTLLTHMFLHSGIMHLGGNMLFLWIFGDNVEDALGHARYLVFYLACGLLAALAQTSVSLGSHIPMLGASGAIAGVLAAYLVLYPRSPITVVNPIPILWIVWGFFLLFPAWLVILEFFVVNLVSALSTSSAHGGVAFVAHVGGFVAGLALLPLTRKHERVQHPSWERWRGQPER